MAQDRNFLTDCASFIYSESKTFGRFIKVNAGGDTIHLNESILKNHPNSLFWSLFSGRWKLPKDPEGNWFLDYDGKVFAYIVLYMNLGFDPKESEADRERTISYILPKALKSHEAGLFLDLLDYFCIEIKPYLHTLVKNI